MQSSSCGISKAAAADERGDVDAFASDPYVYSCILCIASSALQASEGIVGPIDA